MDGDDVIKAVSQTIQIPTAKYKGELLNEQRHGKGKESWEYERVFNNQSYEGEFLYDCLLGTGDYTWDVDNEKTTYEGLFYTSKLEGYGRMSNSNNTFFEGLFRQSSRFGPGVFTNVDGTQDVGMWYGKNLMRLCVTVKPEWVPKIASSAKAKVYLMRFKTLVKVCEDKVDYAKEVLKCLDADEEVMEQSDRLYNTYVRHPKSLFFNSTLFDKQFFSPKDCYIEIAVDPLEQVLEEQSEENSMESTLDEIVDEECTLQIIAENELYTPTLSQTRIADLQEELRAINQDLLKYEEILERAQSEKLKDSSLELISYVEREKKSVCWDNCLFSAQSLSMNTNTLLDFDLDCYQLDEGCYLEACKTLNATEDAIKVLTARRDKLQAAIDYEESKLRSSDEAFVAPPTKQVLVTDLLAWNNEETCVEMMKYAFLHRNFEQNMTFCVAKILCGDRKEFRPFGQYETDCIQFLCECSDGNFRAASDLLTKYDLNPDMCDARGNTGIMFAAARDRHRTIRTLIDFGGNVDVFNDECITPLSLCVLRYLAVQNYVSNWEAAFLRSPYTEAIDSELWQWRQQCSATQVNNDNNAADVGPANSFHFKFEALSDAVTSNYEILEGDFNLSKVHMKLSTILHKNLQTIYPQSEIPTDQIYLFNLECVHLKPMFGEEEEGAKGKKKKKTPKEKKKKKGKGVEKIDEVIEGVEKYEVTAHEILQKDKLRVIHETIVLLLALGSDPNVGEAPMPVLLMSLFTKNVQIVDDILLRNADPNVTTVEEELTGLHIVASLPLCAEMVEEMKVLLRYGANPSIRASVQHWVAEKELLVGNYILQEPDLGKMPLHLLAMRFDFTLDQNDYISKMAQILIENCALANEFYLGHTPLSIAVLRGNAKLVQGLLETGAVNPNEILGEQMGVPLTVWLLKRYTTIPSVADCKDVLEALGRFGANPFNDTGERGHTLAFLRKELEPPEKVTKKQAKRKKEPKKKKQNKPSSREQILKMIEQFAEEVLLKHIKGVALTQLFHLVGHFTNDSKYKARFVSVAESISIMQALFHRGLIPINKCTDHDTLTRLLKFIICVNRQMNPRSSSNVDVEKLLEDFEYKRMCPKPCYLDLPQPEVDEDYEKYKVCFFCYTKIEEEDPIMCPKCELVYFCSMECMSQSSKLKMATHKCDAIFSTSKKGSRFSKLGDRYSGVGVSKSALSDSDDERRKKGRSKKRKKGSPGRSSRSSGRSSKGSPRDGRKDSGNKQDADAKAGRLKYNISGCFACQQARRLPTNYQQFLERVVALWPNLDVSSLFLPYACYSNGQLYYRFCPKTTGMGGTYSML